MTAAIFDSDEGAGEANYRQWLHDHPSGFVLNSRRRCDPTYMVLHKTKCHSISRVASQMGNDPFTGRAYIKICSENPDDLLAWIRRQGGSGFSKRCSICCG